MDITTKYHGFKMIFTDDGVWTAAKHGEMVAKNFIEQMEKNNMTESINHPNHYLGTRKYEPIDVINDWELNFQTGNAVKYISRAGRKNPEKTIEDLEKAIWYLQYEINQLKAQK